MTEKIRWQMWLRASLIRTLKTVVECMLSMLTVGQAFVDVNWMHLFSVSGVAGIIAFLTCIKGLPEVDDAKIYKRIVNDGK